MKFDKIKGFYASPRISGEVLDCSMPMTFDQFSNCGYNCMYCFSTFQRAIGAGKDAYLKKQYKAVSLERFKKLFDPEHKNPFQELIKQKITLQWGGLSDPLCPIEEQDGLGYEILKFLKEIKYPICFSSKSDLLLRDKKYLDLFEGMGEYWSYKASIITWDEKMAKIFEAGCPSPQRRMEVLKKLSDMGIWTILRLRPFIIGLSDKTVDDLLGQANAAGVKALSTEFFCLEIRSKNVAKDKYETMSKALGFDILDFYENVSTGIGYLRLNYNIKKPYIDNMQQLCDKHGINFHVSDAHHKEKGCSGSCCGLPQKSINMPSLSNYSLCQFTNAINICKEKGEVSWDDIAQHGDWLKKINILRAPGFNTGSIMRKAKIANQSLYDYMRNAWNDPKSAHSPYKYFEGVMKPDRLDENNNIIYKFIDK